MAVHFFLARFFFQPDARMISSSLSKKNPIFKNELNLRFKNAAGFTHLIFFLLPLSPVQNYLFIYLFIYLFNLPGEEKKKKNVCKKILQGFFFEIFPDLKEKTHYYYY